MCVCRKSRHQDGNFLLLFSTLGCFTFRKLNLVSVNINKELIAPSNSG